MRAGTQQFQETLGLPAFKTTGAPPTCPPLFVLLTSQRSRLCQPILSLAVKAKPLDKTTALEGRDPATEKRQAPYYVSCFLSRAPHCWKSIQPLGLSIWKLGIGCPRMRHIDDDLWPKQSGSIVCGGSCLLQGMSHSQRVSQPHEFSFWKLRNRSSTP